MAQVTLTNDERQFYCEDGEILLHAALRSNIGLPYECNSGGCGCCKFQLMDGQVDVIEGTFPGVSERDSKKNRFLACQTRIAGNCQIRVPQLQDYSDYPPVRALLGKVVSKVQVTPQMMQLCVDLGDVVDFLPGQYALLSVPGSSCFRAYSMSQKPGEGNLWEFYIKRVEGGTFTSALFSSELEVGSSIEVSGPFGHAYWRQGKRQVICVAGGSGIAPMLSIARAALASDDVYIHFYYGVRCSDEVFELADLLHEGRDIAHKLALHIVVSEPDEAWQGRKGFVHQALLEDSGKFGSDSAIYFAGPPPMVKAMETSLRDALDIDPQDYYFDRFY